MKKSMKKKSIILLTIVLVVIMVTLVAFQSLTYAAYNYGDVMGESIAWFDANRCGNDVKSNNVFSSWRGNCHTSDSVDGGFHDAGDHVKFQLPAAFSASAIGFSIYEFRSSWESSGALNKAWQELKIFCDYSMDSWNGSTMVVQVGDGGSDHGYWGPPENQTTSRPTSRSTGSDILGQTAGSLALMYMNYKSVDSSYANKCLSAAKSMFNVGKSNLNTRSTAANGFYTSSSNYDDMLWAGIWLYMATDDESYIANADSWFEQKNDSGDDQYEKPWTYCWDDSTLANTIMMYKITGDKKYYDAMIWNFDYYTKTLNKTPYGLPYLDTWGVLRYATAEAGLIYTMYKEFGVSDYNKTANMMVDYALGSNPSSTSFITNYGSKSVKHPHHRANEPNRDGVTNGMTGALAGGPNNDDSFQDDVNNYTNNEVALDYNASFLFGCAGRKYVSDGGSAGTPKPTPTPAPTSAPGNGDGLLGKYYAGTTLSGDVVLSRVDSEVDFEWGGGSPNSDIPSDGFSATWTGQVEARSDENYTFYINHDDGARVTVDGELVVDNWNDHAAVEDSGTIALEMGKKYDIVVDFYENSGDATCQLSWSSPTIKKEIIPQDQLYSGQSSLPSPSQVVSSTPSILPSSTPSTINSMPATPTTPPPVSPTPSITEPSEEVDYEIVNDWGAGATVSVTITNTGNSTMNSWNIVWEFPGDQKITNLWGGSYTQSGQTATVKNDSWNGTISPNSSVKFGFNMTYSGSNSVPSSFTLN